MLKDATQDQSIIRIILAVIAFIPGLPINLIYLSGMSLLSIPLAAVHFYLLWTTGRGIYGLLTKSFVPTPYFLPALVLSIANSVIWFFWMKSGT